MTDNQSRLADSFLRVLQKNGGTQNIDIITNQLEDLGIDIEENPIDFEIVERYLIRHNIIETIPPDNYFYNSLVDSDEVVEGSVNEYIKQREAAKNRPRISGHNIVINSGNKSTGDINDYSSSSGLKTVRSDQTAQKVTTPSIYGKAVSRWFWWIMGIIAGVIVLIIGSTFIN